MVSLTASFPRYNHKNKDGNHESLAKTDWQLSSRERANSTDVAGKCAKSLATEESQAVYTEGSEAANAAGCGAHILPMIRES